MPDPDYGETWVYESIVGALPGVALSDRAAVAVQFLLFEAGVLGFGVAYDLPAAVVPGTVAVGVAAAGSAFMLDIGARVRALDVPAAYSRLLFGSSIEVVLGLIAYVASLTYLFVYDPRAGPTLLGDLLGTRPPLVPAGLLLLVLWDVCYRIGTGWWAAVAALYRSLSADFDADTARALRTVDRHNAAFALVQLALVPFLRAHPVLAVAVVGHVAATLLVVAVARGLAR